MNDYSLTGTLGFPFSPQNLDSPIESKKRPRLDSFQRSNGFGRCAEGA